MKKVRVYFPLGTEYYMESPWVEINGRRAFDPVKDQPQLKLADIVNEAVQKGQAVIDASMCISDCYDNGMSGNAANQKGSYMEYDQIELTLATAEDTVGTARIGLSGTDLNLGIFGGAAGVSDIATVGGTFTTNTLAVLANLANAGFLKFSKIHFEAGADAFFATTPRFKSFSHTGKCTSDVSIHYPKATPGDDNTNIRTIDEQYLKSQNIDLTLNGRNYLELIVPAEQTVSITIFTCFRPKS